jgi:hypothetical protein
MEAEPGLSPTETVELDRRLADVHRYPLQLDAYHWRRLRDLARSGNRRGQLLLLRGAVPTGGVSPSRSGDSRPVGTVVELLDRVQQLELRLTAVEQHIIGFESGRSSLTVEAAASPDLNASGEPE